MRGTAGLLHFLGHLHPELRHVDQPKLPARIGSLLRQSDARYGGVQVLIGCHCFPREVNASPELGTSPKIPRGPYIFVPARTALFKLTHYPPTEGA